ncbi:hypothetical protein GRF29_28g2310034 [Pseudopithomyces chartarum]|uniref:Uncharacterized protein n=1 Tax=Pseudopithomyces chartarum TaxID=1892770 RepID=A0AAN6RI70_9PLEO|nr:hypothetical protein GRF29_28g2310034 [Pseudopithomyces chartarum]
MSYKELQEASLGLLAEEDHRGSSADTEAFHPPAESAIEYETVVFETNLRADIEAHKPNIYLELSDEGDAAWEFLTEGTSLPLHFLPPPHHPLTHTDPPLPLSEYATSLISPSQASHLPFLTASSPTTPTKYLTGLSVFHQLHCLNRILGGGWEVGGAGAGGEDGAYV